jgi:hypothetical protein
LTLPIILKPQLLLAGGLGHDAGMSTAHRFRFAALLGLACTPAMAQQDVSIAMMTKPLSGCSLGAETSVKLHMFNHGDALPAGSRIELSYTINGSEAVRESLTLAATLLQNSAIAHEFSTTADLSAPASYSFSANVDLKDDANPMNNTLNGHVVVHWAPSEGGRISGPERATSGTLLLREYRGQVAEWQQSSDGGASWDAIANATPTLAFEELARTTLFRAEVRNGGCAPAYSSEWIVAPE